MVFPVVGGTQDTGYEISNSFRTGASSSTPTSNAYLKNTLSSAATEETFTVSAWVKLSGTLGNSFYIWGGNQPNSSPYQYSYFRFIDTSGTASQTIHFKGTQDDGTNFDIESNALFRDPSAWYHAVLSVDTTQGTASNRVKIYINGSQLTSLQTSNYPSQNAGIRSSSNGAMQTVGTWNYENTNYAPNDDGYISEFYFIDGQALDPTYFGETNDNGVWTPKNYTGTYGTHGVRFEFKQTGSGTNSSGIGADTSGNDNHFAVTNSATTDITTDTPTNNFCTLNPLVPHHSIFDAETEGNTGLSSSGVQLRGGYMGSTIMPTSGKWYFEVKIVSITNSTDRTGIAIPRFESVTGDDHIEGGDYAGFTLSTGSTGRVFVTEGSSTTETDNSDYAFVNNDIAIFAVDMDASTPRVYVGKNGTWFTTSAGSGGNPASDTGYFEVNLNTGGSGFSVGARHSAGASAAQSYLYNFGQPAYTISSGNSDANGYGNFEYAVPSGYYSICTKNLAEYG